MNQLKIGDVSLYGRVFLAPMAGVSDLSFRELAIAHGAALACCEMVSAKALTMKNPATIEMLATSPGDRPSSIQLFGHEPAVMAEAAHMLNVTPFEFLDINMGCPVPKIVKNGEGSALMRNPKLVFDIVSAVVGASSKPVTAKIRKGIDGVNRAVEIAKAAEAAGAAAIAAHGRTKEQLYEGSADWGVIAAVKSAVKIPVIGNGDVNSPQAAQAMFEQTGCDAVMIGRAAHGNPWIFERVNAYLATGEEPPGPSGPKRFETAIAHTKALCARKSEYIGIREARGHLCAYVKGMRGAAEARALFNKAETFSDIVSVLSAIGGGFLETVK